MKRLFVATLVAASLAACSGNSDKEAYDASLPKNDSIKATNANVTPAVNAPVNPLPAGTQNQPIVVNPGATQVQQVPVVQPTTPPVITSSLAQPQGNATVATATTAPGMNPPHGQPGHRCDISVGAPLNSKPAANNTPVVTQAPATATQVNVPVTPTAPGMNPPHGQPGHRCDIAVGAPLDGKPAATTPAVTVPVATPVADSAKGVTGSKGGK